MRHAVLLAQDCIRGEDSEGVDNAPKRIRIPLYEELSPRGHRDV